MIGAPGSVDDQYAITLEFVISTTFDGIDPERIEEPVLSAAEGPRAGSALQRAVAAAPVGMTMVVCHDDCDCVINLPAWES